jgi:hypothetical protein
MDPLAPGLEPGADHGERRALAVGAGDVDHRRQVAFGVAERRQEPPDPVQRQVDDLGMQRHHPREDGVGGVAAHGLASEPAAAGLPAGFAPAFPPGFPAGAVASSGFASAAAGAGSGGAGRRRPPAAGR